jgi:hypothetical protein
MPFFSPPFDTPAAAAIFISFRYYFAIDGQPIAYAASPSSFAR